jgi:hypothetical protein
MITRAIKNAINEILAARIDRANYGMLSTKRTSFSSHNLLAINGIKITSGMCYKDSILQNGVEIGKIHYRYASQKRNGMYKMLKPQIEWL